MAVRITCQNPPNISLIEFVTHRISVTIMVVFHTVTVENYYSLDRKKNGAICNNLIQMSLVTRKPVFGVCDQVSLKPAYSATEASWSLGILDLASIGSILSKQQTAKVLIRLHGCASFLMMGYVLYTFYFIGVFRGL